jgi:hypothetical protein
MATLFRIDGFEHGNPASGVAGVYDTIFGSPGIVTTPVRTGARALEISAAASAEYVRYSFSAGVRRVATSFYVRFAGALPTADVRLAHVTGTVEGRFWFRNTNDKFAIAWAGINVEGGPTLVPDTWYRVDIDWDTRADPLLAKCRIDGGTEFEQFNSSAAQDITAAGLGTTTGDTFTAYYDDWVISVTDGDYPLGGYHVEPLSPAADGAHNITTLGDFDGTTTQFSNATTDSYLNIDDVPLNSSNVDGEVIRQDLGTTDEYMEHLYSNLPAGTDVPVDVRVYAVDVDGAITGTNLAVLKFLLEDNTPLTDVRLSSDDPGTTVTWRKKMLDRPIGGWVGSHVDGLKSRWGFSNANPDAILLGVLIEVAMTVPPPPPPESFPTRRSLVA